MNKKQVVVLSKGDFDNSWSIIDEDDLEKWLEDGSINKGDKVVYPNQIMDVVLKKELKCVNEVQDES